MANSYLRDCFGWFIEFDKLKEWVKQEANIDIDDENNDKTVDFICFIEDWKKIIHSAGNEFVIKIQYTSSGDSSLVDDRYDYKFMFGIYAEKFDKATLLKIFNFMETELYQKEMVSWVQNMGFGPFEEPAVISDSGSYD